MRLLGPVLFNLWQIVVVIGIVGLVLLLAYVGGHLVHRYIVLPIRRARRRSERERRRLEAEFQREE